ncbi:hypothetical protein ZWY2020_024960 [Hordeum vulgare]|nr:hypothetical protein ZWY2020_024960 [Hordeum vulgare]
MAAPPTVAATLHKPALPSRAHFDPPRLHARWLCFPLLSRSPRYSTSPRRAGHRPLASELPRLTSPRAAAPWLTSQQCYRPPPRRVVSNALGAIITLRLLLCRRATKSPRSAAL